MSAANDFGIPEYARPNMKDFKKYFSEGNKSEEIFKNEILSSLTSRCFPERDINAIAPDDFYNMEGENNG